jgi:hypothetical protein
MTKPRKNGLSSAGIARSVPGGGARCEGVEMEEVREASHPRIAIGSLDKGGEDSLDEPGRGGEAGLNTWMKGIERPARTKNRCGGKRLTFRRRSRS